MAQMPDTFKPIDMPESFQPIITNEPEPGLLERAKSVWDTANKPLVDIRSGGLKTATDEFAAQHPIVGGGMNFATDVLSSLTSPLSLGLGALTAGGSLAESTGLSGLSKALEVPGKITAAGMVGHGGYNLVRPDATMPQRAGGLLEAGLGGLGLKSHANIEVPKLNLGEEVPVSPEKNLAPGATNTLEEIDAARDRAAQRRMGDFDRRTYGTLAPDEIPKLPELSRDINPPVNISTQSPVIQKLQTAIDTIQPLNKEQQKIYSLERSERLAKMKDIETPGQAGYLQQLGTLKGPMEKVSFEPLKLEQPDVDSLFDTISNHPAGIGYNEIKAKTGLAKLLSGQVPQRNEIELLNRIFGDQVTESLSKNLPTINRAGGLVSEAVNLPKSLMASFDLSAPFRQGLGLAHKKEFWTSFDDMLKAFGSENGFKAVQSNIESDPNFNLSQSAGLHLSELTGMTNREEAFMSNWAERIPLIGHGVRASDRAYVGFLNKLRSDTFSSLVDNAESAAKSLQLTAKDPTELAAAKMANPKTNLVLANEMANFVNTATGRGKLGSLESSAVALNNMFFSPRLIASRVRMLNPQTYINASPAVRKEYLKSLLTIASVGGIVGSLGKAAGGDVSGEPFSSDLGKIKFGDTRLDPYGGFQQYIVAANRLMSGQQTSSTSGRTYELGSKYGLPTRLDVVKNFAANKLAPVPKFAYDLLNANKQQPFTFSDKAAGLFIPLVIQDTIDLANSNPKLIPGLVPLAGLGMGLQTYPQPGITQQIGNLLTR